MRRPAQLGQSARPLHEKATSVPHLQCVSHLCQVAVLDVMPRGDRVPSVVQSTSNHLLAEAADRKTCADRATEILPRVGSTMDLRQRPVVVTPLSQTGEHQRGIGTALSATTLEDCQCRRRKRHEVLTPILRPRAGERPRGSLQINFRPAHSDDFPATLAEQAMAMSSFQVFFLPSQGSRRVGRCRQR
jgi:hypothetical protein